MRRQSVFRNSLLNPYNDHCSVLSKTAFVQIGPRISMQVQRVMERYTQDATRKHTTYTLSRRKTRTDTHHSRALDSPLELAYTHTAVFDENLYCIGWMAARAQTALCCVVSLYMCPCRQDMYKQCSRSTQNAIPVWKGDFKSLRWLGLKIGRDYNFPQNCLHPTSWSSQDQNETQ